MSFFSYGAMSRNRPEGLLWMPTWQNFYLGTRRFLPYPVGGWQSRRLDSCLSKERCRPWTRFEPANSALYNQR